MPRSSSSNPTPTTPSPPLSPVPWLEPAVASWIVGNVVVVVAVASAIGAALVRVSVGTFYSRLGTTPSEVGFSATDTLSRTIVGLFVGLASILLVLAVSGPLAFGVHRLWRWRHPTSSPFPWLLVKNRLLLVVPASLLLLYAIITQDIPEPLFTTTSSAISAIAALCFMAALWRSYSQHSVGLVLTLVTALLMGLALVVVSAELGASQASHLAMKGNPPERSFKVDTVWAPSGRCVQISATDRLSGTQDGLVLLGESSGSLTFYDLLRQASVRHPSDSIAVAGSSRCDTYAEAGATARREAEEPGSTETTIAAELEEYGYRVATDAARTQVPHSAIDDHLSGDTVGLFGWLLNVSVNDNIIAISVANSTHFSGEFPEVRFFCRLDSTSYVPLAVAAVLAPPVPITLDPASHYVGTVENPNSHCDRPYVALYHGDPLGAADLVLFWQLPTPA